MIDVAKEYEKLPSAAKNKQTEKIHEINKQTRSLIVVLGDKKYHDPEYLYAACEDNLQDDKEKTPNSKARGVELAGEFVGFSQLATRTDLVKDKNIA